MSKDDKLKQTERNEVTQIDALFERISDLIEQGRRYVNTSVNLAEVRTRFEVGRYIFENEQQGMRAEYGKQVLKNLSVRLIERFGSDWSYDTLVRCRKFYTVYHNVSIEATPLPQLERGADIGFCEQSLHGKFSRLIGFPRNAAFNTLTNIVYDMNRYEEVVRLGMNQ